MKHFRVNKMDGISIVAQKREGKKEFKELNRRVTQREYEKVLNAALELGIENGFFQDGETARESFIPAFDYEGIRKSVK